MTNDVFLSAGGLLVLISSQRVLDGHRPHPHSPSTAYQDGTIGNGFQQPDGEIRTGLTSAATCIPYCERFFTPIQSDTISSWTPLLNYLLFKMPHHQLLDKTE